MVWILLGRPGSLKPPAKRIDSVEDWAWGILRLLVCGVWRSSRGSLLFFSGLNLKFAWFLRLSEGSESPYFGPSRDFRTDKAEVDLVSAYLSC